MQCIIATDGGTSFAIFLYENADFMDLGRLDYVGFASGNDSISLTAVDEKNIYRIDGKGTLLKW